MDYQRTKRLVQLVLIWVLAFGAICPVFGAVGGQTLADATSGKLSGTASVVNCVIVPQSLGESSQGSWINRCGQGERSEGA